MPRDEGRLLGAEKMSRKFRRMIRNMPGEVGKALFAEAQIERTESIKRTPRDTGALRGSHEVERPVIKRGEISVAIVVGGPAIPYAIPVHEDLDRFHPIGQAKFLESTILESAPHMAGRVAKRIDLNRMAK